MNSYTIMSFQKTSTQKIDEDYDYYDYDDFSVNINVKSSNSKKKSKNTTYSSKHVRNYTKGYNK